LRFGYIISAIVALATTGIILRPAGAQSELGKEAFARVEKPAESGFAYQPYRQPTEKARLHNYISWMFSPYSLASVTFVSGLHQAEHDPPDWREGWPGFGQRMASNFGTSLANATARYALSEALQEDTLYYRCQCRGFWPRMRHAVFSAAIARRGADGHSVFGLPELVSPYAGPFASVYGWYPSRYGWKDAIRMGNHGLLDEVGTNISIEFLPSILGRRGRRWARRLHLGNPGGASGAP
jgi:hypothetical protein